MKLPPNMAWMVLALAGLGLGVPVGRVLRGWWSEPEAMGQGLSKSGMAGETGRVAKPGGVVEETDESVEGEIARLVGQAPKLEGRSPEEVIALIRSGLKENSDLKRYLMLYEAVGQLPKESLRDAFHQAREAGNAVAMRAIERRWAEVDPLAALELWSEHGPDRVSDAFFTAWSRLSPLAALRWLETLPEGDRKGSTRSAILGTIARSDPQRALDYANQLADGPDRAQLVAKAFEVFVSKNSAQALAAAKMLPEGSGKQAAFDTVIKKMADSNLEEAQRLLASLPPDSVSMAGREVGSRMAQGDPESAVRWANSLPEGKSRQGAFWAIAGAWATKDVAGAAAWLDGMPAGPSRDAAVEGFAVRTAPKDPEGSAIWAATLPPGSTRAAVLKRSVGIWHRYDAAAAEEWLATTPGLTAEERVSLKRAAKEPLDLKSARKVK